MKAVTSIILSTVAVVLAAPVPEPTPVCYRNKSLLSRFLTKNWQPGIPTASSARTTLASLQVAAQVDDGNYKRSLFHTWDIIHGKCNTRYVPSSEYLDYDY